MKKQMLAALALLLLIPAVLMAGGFLFSLINPEIAAGHPNYVRNYHYLNLLKSMMALASAALAGILWLLVCFLLIRSKQRSLWWLFCAALGPFGLAVLAMLNDKAPAPTDRYERFVRRLKSSMRVAYEACTFVIVWLLAYAGMVAMRNLMILGQSIATGMSTAQIVDIQAASSGMWAFAEGNEVIFLVALLYLLRPFAFHIVGHFTAVPAPPNAR